MPIVIGAKPENDFNDPIGILGDCHRRIELFLGVLRHVAAELPKRTITYEQRASFENALRYFRDAAPKHTADEEESLFPKLKARNNAELLPLLAEIEALEEDHGCADGLHREVDGLGQRWLADGELTASEAQRLTAALDELQAIYTRHIEAEDKRVFPAARTVLTHEELRLTGIEMRQRRRI